MRVTATLPSQARPLLAALRSRLAPVCVAVAHPEPEGLFRLAAAALEESPFVELRLDSLNGLGRSGSSIASTQVSAVHAESTSSSVIHDDLLLRLRQFCGAHPEAAVLATCRREAGGGAFAGSIQDQLALLVSCAEAGAVLVDVELETLEAAAPEELQRFGEELLATGGSLLVSAHDFAGTGDPTETLQRLHAAAAPAGPAIYKVVSTATSLADNLVMLRFVEVSARELPLVGICMGAAGVPSRVLALRAGALFTFGSTDGAAATAAGQVPARRLLQEFRVAELTAQTRLYGVAGNPIGHSLSPALHNAGFRVAGMDAVYLPLETTSVSDLFALVEGLQMSGLSITMPGKVELLQYLREAPGSSVDPEAAAIGAVNTLARLPEGGFRGLNTDAAAVTEPLGDRLQLRGARVLLLGAGGAARAAAFGLRGCGAEVAILNRTESAAEQLAAECGGLVARHGELGGFDAVVQATPAGMDGLGAELPVSLEVLRTEVLAAHKTRRVRVVFEMVYRPAETPLTRLARELGIEVIGGLEMFLHQGARQWAVWTGQAPPMEAMRAALQAALDREAYGETRGQR